MSIENETAEFYQMSQYAAGARGLSGADMFIPVSAFANRPVPERTWLIDRMIPSETVTLLGGDGGSGKSLLALQLAVSVASGGKWLHRAPASGGVLYCGAEDDTSEMHRRLDKITQASGVDYGDLRNLHICALAGQDALLATADAKTGTLKPTALWQKIKDKVSSEKPALVVFDTLADLFGGNENDRALARQFIGQLRGLAIEFQCAVLLLAHPSLSGMNSGSGTSGSTAWNNSVRSRLYLERIIEDGYEHDTSARKLTIKKSNYGDTGNEIAMHWADGVFEAKAQETQLDRTAITAKADRVFLKLLTQMEGQGRMVNDTSGANFAPTKFSKMPDAEGVTKHAFKGAMERLFASGKIEVAEVVQRGGRVKKCIQKVA